MGESFLGWGGDSWGVDGGAGDEVLLAAVAGRDVGAFRVLIWLLAFRSGAPGVVLQARAQAGFLALAAASFSIFVVRRRRLRQLRPWR